MTNPKKQPPQSAPVVLKQKEFNFPEGVYVLKMVNLIVKDMAIVNISLGLKGGIFTINLNYDLSKTMVNNWNTIKICWDDLASRKKLKTLQDAMTLYSKRDKAYLV